MRLAYDLSAPIVLNQLGVIPSPDEPAKRVVLTDSLTRLNGEADRVGSRLAFLTGSESPRVVADLLRSVPHSGLGINFAPAPLVAAGEDLEQAIEQLAPWIASVHVRDIVRSALASSGVREVPLGDGEIDWRRVLRLLDMVDGCQHLTLVREPAAGGEKALAAARAYLLKLMG
jgi:sugar phosphate isomerase/epimerase